MATPYQKASLSFPPFLLMEGGPLNAIEKRVGLFREHAPLVKRRAFVSILLTWLPLLVLSAIQGRAIGHSVPVPFVHDFSAYTRFLLAIPLLLLAENLLGPRIAEAAAHFVTSGVVAEKDYDKFREYLERGLRLRNSTLAEIVIAIFAFIFSFVGFREMSVHVTTWYATRVNDSAQLTLAGWWLLGFCAPLFQFLVFRWLWRLFLWFQFLNRVRSLDLHLYPTHPDGAGGLGFVGEAQRFFGALLFAISIAITGVIANNVIYDKTPLVNFGAMIASYVVLAVLAIVGPLVVFSGKLLTTKRCGLADYGTLATSYTGAFGRKWIEGHDPDHERLLGTNDIQSLSDLENSYGYIQKMKAIPVEPRTLLHLVVASLLPMTLLLLAIMPLKDVLRLVFKVLM